MYNINWNDVEKVLEENNVTVRRENDIVTGIETSNTDNCISSSICNGTINELSLKNDRVSLEYKNSPNEVYLHIIYGKISADVKTN